MPQTIRDFIDVSRRPGLAYIWVDALCIAQDDEEELSEQCGLMVSFYLKSELVVSAAMASHSDQAFLPDPRSIESSYGAFIRAPIPLSTIRRPRGRPRGGNSSALRKEYLQLK